MTCFDEQQETPRIEFEHIRNNIKEEDNLINIQKDDDT
jgi:hypothetical protein